MKGQLLIDWFTFSVKEAIDPDKVIRDYLHMDPDLFQKAVGGLLGYQSCKVFDNIRVCYEPPLNKDGTSRVADMGICVSMSGDGCRAFETHTRLKSGDTPFWALAEQLHVDPLVSISRVDLAIDDHSGVLDLDVIVEAVRNNTINSRIEERNIREGYKVSDRAGMTVYFGAPQSAFRIRIYDKAKEFYKPAAPEYSQHWVRFEMVLKGSHAKGLVACMANFEDMGEVAAGILNDKLSFIERDDTNITRCSLCQWWLDFLESLAFVKLVCGEEVPHSVDRTFDWLINQVGPALSMVRDAKGILAVEEIIKAGLENRSSKHTALLEDYRNARRGVSV